MKITSKIINGLQSEVDNNRGHKIITDVPENIGGNNLGPTSLELTSMGLGGCITTIFMMLANKMRLTIIYIEAELEIEKLKTSPTITSVFILVKVKSEEPVVLIEKCLNLTIQNCPVSILFEDAGIPIEYDLITL